MCLLLATNWKVLIFWCLFHLQGCRETVANGFWQPLREDGGLQHGRCHRPRQQRLQNVGQNGLESRPGAGLGWKPRPDRASAYDNKRGAGWYPFHRHIYLFFISGVLKFFNVPFSKQFSIDLTPKVNDGQWSTKDFSRSLVFSIIYESWPLLPIALTFFNRLHPHHHKEVLFWVKLKVTYLMHFWGSWRPLHLSLVDLRFGVTSVANC